MVARRRKRGAKDRSGDKGTDSAAEYRHPRCRSAFARGSGKRCCGTAPPRRNRGRWARSANLVLAMQYRGLEHTIPLRLSNNAVAMLTLEAQVREISLGQLVGMLIEAAMAQDLSRVLDKNPTDEPE